MFNTFVSTCAVAFRITNGHNKTCSFDTEDFIPISSFYGVVGSLSWFTKCLIGITGNILSVMYFNSKCIYSLETHACTIVECVIVCNVHHVTSTWPFIYWWLGGINARHNPHTEIPSWNSLEVNFAPASVLILYVYHQPNSDTFPNMTWNVYNLSMTSSVVMFYIPSSFRIL